MYEFDINNDPNIRRHDYSWNHPSMEGVEPMACDQAVWAILDRNKTFEEQMAAQAVFKKALAESLAPLTPEMEAKIDVREMFVPGLNEDDPDVRCLVVSPKGNTKKKLPGLIHCFGGGMIMGSPDSQLQEIGGYVSDLQCVCVAVDYRLLPEWRYPAAVDDIEAVVNYILANQEEMHINPKKMVITGQSAGAYVAACAAQRLKLRGGYQFAGQLLVYPVIDDTFDYPSSNLYYGEIWHPNDDQRVFEEMLGENYNRSAAPVDAIPSHCRDFKGLPPTVMMTGDLDYGHDPVIKYAQGIMDAGIYCDLHVWGGCFHGFMAMAAGTEVSNRALRDVTENLGVLMTGKCVRS